MAHRGAKRSRLRLNPSVRGGRPLGQRQPGVGDVVWFSGTVTPVGTSSIRPSDREDVIFGHLEALAEFCDGDDGGAPANARKIKLDGLAKTSPHLKARGQKATVLHALTRRLAKNHVFAVTGPPRRVESFAPSGLDPREPFSNLCAGPYARHSGSHARMRRAYTRHSGSRARMRAPYAGGAAAPPHRDVRRADDVDAGACMPRLALCAAGGGDGHV